MNKPSVIKKTIKDFIPSVVRERSHRKVVIPKVKTYDLKNIKNREKEKSNQFITDGKKTEKGKNEKGKNEKGQNKKGKNEKGKNEKG